MQKQDVLRLRLTDQQTALWYLGQVGFLIGNGRTFLAIDPYLSDYVDQNCSQRVAWRRLYATPIAPRELDFLEAVLCTHTHCDHADPWTLTAIAAANPNTKFIVPAPEAELIATYGIDRARIVPARADEPLQLDGFLVTPIPSAHETLHPDENGNYRELGYVLEDANHRIFHAGDMCLY
jgi:L-ascorbate metabolism protein UlaG (beta-lactamase superfamily)